MSSKIIGGIAILTTLFVVTIAPHPIMMIPIVIMGLGFGLALILDHGGRG